MLLSLALYSIRPYKLVQQALGESILNNSAYSRDKGTVLQRRRKL